MIKIILLCCLCLALCSGCEWTSGGGVETWDSSSDWVNFSGSYKASDGGMLVTKFGTGSASANTNIVSAALIGTANGTATVFFGNLDYIPIPGSFNIDVGGYVFWDSEDGSGTTALSVIPNDGASGTINYDTGSWSLAFPAPLANGLRIYASYAYTRSIHEQGNHGRAIYSFVVYQTGNHIKIIDNNGAVYEGRIGSVRTSGGFPPEQSGVVPTSGPVDAQFSATGVSEGYNVTIVGVLQGTLSGNALSGRTMRATYIEENGQDSEIIAIYQ